MMMDKQSFEVRDLRIKNKFIVDDVFIDKYARIVGIYATGVYASLCRHVDKHQKCFPSMRRIAEELSISIKQVSRSIKKLEEHNLVRANRQGKTLTNRYYLVDKSEWTDSPITLLPRLDNKGLFNKNKAKNSSNTSLSSDGTHSPITTDSQSSLTGLSVPSNIVRKHNSKETHSKGKGEEASPAYFKITEKEKEEIARLGEQLIADLKFNVFAFIGKVNNQAGYLPPIDRIIKIAKNALKAKPKNTWGYFAKALAVEMPRAFAELRIAEGESYKDQGGIPEAMKEIMQKALDQKVGV